MIMLKKELLLNLHDAIAKIDTTECYSQTLITVYKNEVQKISRECFCHIQWKVLRHGIQLIEMTTTLIIIVT